MIPTTKLFPLLSALALTAIALTALEAAPGALAKPHGARHVDHHRHLAARKGIFKEVKKRSKTIKRGADGSQCRVKGQTYSPSGAVAAATATSSSEVAITTSSTPAWTDAYTTSATVQNDWATATSSSTWVAPASSSPASSGSSGSGATGGSDTSGTNAGSKFGLGWPNGNWATSGEPSYVGNYIGSKSSWYYTWNPTSIGSADSLGIEFVPMLWGPNQVAEWWASQAVWPSSVKNALFFNEPNEVSQCNMGAGDAVSYWMNDFAPVRASKGISLGGAATTNAPSGLQWIQEFQTLCTQYGNSAADCQMDFVPIHWYSTDLNEFQSYVSNFHAQTGLDIWITEYACQSFSGGAQCSDGDTWNLHQSMAAWFDSQDYVKRYSPFGVMENLQGVNEANALMDTSGGITSLGSWYIYSA